MMRRRTYVDGWKMAAWNPVETVNVLDTGPHATRNLGHLQLEMFTRIKKGFVDEFKWEVYIVLQDFWGQGR